MKKKLLTIVTLLAFVFTSSAICSVDEPKSLATKQTLTGVATPLVEQDIQFGYNDAYRGWINYTAKPGQLFFGPIYDTNGKCIREGTLLIQLDTAYRIAGLDYAKARYQQNVANMKLAKLNYERYARLVPSHSVSESDYESMKSAYEAAIAATEAGKANIQLTQSILDFCTYRAKYDGIVEQVYFPFGWLAGELKVMRVALISPIGIKVAMDRTLASKINRNTPITIYPMNSDKPFGAYHGMITYTNDGIMFSVDNYLCELQTPQIEGGKISIINTTTAVRSYRSEGRASVDDPPVVYVSCIFQDEKGSYVWKVNNQKGNEPGHGTDFVVTVHKVYISSKKIKINDDHFMTSVVLDPKGELSYGDILIPKESIPIEGLKDGEQVLISSERYMFMPGDKVKVEIGPNPKKLQ